MPWPEGALEAVRTPVALHLQDPKLHAHLQHLAAVMGADKARTHAAGLVAEALQRCGQVGPQAV
jgi:hypothetical protein